MSEQLERFLLRCAVRCHDTYDDPFRRLWRLWRLWRRKAPLRLSDDPVALFERTFVALVAAGSIDGELTHWHDQWGEFRPCGWFRVPRSIKLQAAGATWIEEPRP